MDIDQRDIVVVDFNPVRGHEQNGKRPAVVISGASFHVSGGAIVCPVTTKIKNYGGDVVLKPNSNNKLDATSEILVGQVRTISIERISKKIGVISTSELQCVFEGLDLLFDRER